MNEVAELTRQNDDIKRLRNEEINLTHIARSHILKCEIDRLQNVLNKDRKDHQREKELMFKDFQQKHDLNKLEHDRALNCERQRYAALQKKLDHTTEEFKAEIVGLNEEVDRKTVEITKVEADHSEKLIENENRLKTEYELKIKKIQVDHYHEICVRETMERRLVEDNKALKSDVDNLRIIHENDLSVREQEHKQAVEDAIEELNNKWRNKSMQFEREFQIKEKSFVEEISLLGDKIHRAHMETDERWQLIMEQKQNEMDLMKENLERNLEEANEKHSALENKFLKEKVRLKNEAQMKLNQKVTELNEDFKKKLEERVNTMTSNLRHEMEQKEKDHQYKMEMKEKQMATMKEALARAQAGKTAIGEFKGKYIFIKKISCSEEKFRQAVERERETAEALTQKLTQHRDRQTYG